MNSTIGRLLCTGILALCVSCGSGGGGGGSKGGTANQAPTARIAVTPDSGQAPLTVTCDGSASSDDDGTLTGYDWDFGDGTTGNGVSLDHTYPAAGTYTVTLTVTDDDGATDGATAAVTVTAPNQAPTAQFVATPTSGDAPLNVGFDASASADADGSIASYGWAFGDGSVATGQVVMHTYTVPGSYDVVLTVADDDGATDTASDTVVPIDIHAPPPDPATVAPTMDGEVAPSLHRTSAFLYSGASPTQKGVDPADIVPRQAAVLRGKVVERDGGDLSGVQVGVRGHSEFGWTLSRSDGMFDLVVNGGGSLTLDYAKEGYLPVHRQVEAPWGDYVQAPEVALVARDFAVTTVDLTSQAPFQVARADPVTDGDGTRHPTVLVHRGTGAQIYQADGTLQDVTTLNIRITEYTVGDNGPQAMPAQLPPTSAYTYAFELDAEEAAARVAGKDVLFDQPLYYYVENFVGFAVGTNVPVGYYDPDRSAWVASHNGVVLEILGVSGGTAQVDTTGDAVTDNGADLAGFPLSDDERVQLASLYTAGQTLWRIPLEHFSTWDANWGWGPPDDADPPEVDFEEEEMLDDDCTKPGSLLSCRNQTLGESVEVVGTPFTLHYSSDRTPGRASAYTLDIPLSGSTLPGTPIRIELEIEVAGRRFTHTVGSANSCRCLGNPCGAAAVPGLLDGILGCFSLATPAYAQEALLCTCTGYQPEVVEPLENQSYTFRWDGLDAYGRTVAGVQPVTVRVGYTYCGMYTQTSRFGYNGNGVKISGAFRDRTVTLWDEWQGRLGTWDARGAGLGGWTLDVQHAYGPTVQVLFRGDGTRRDARALGRVITTVAGAGCDAGTDADDIPALQARLWSPRGVEVGPDGSIYIAETAAGRVRKVDPDGIITTLASGLYTPYDVALGPDGSVYVVETINRSTVSRLNPDGSLAIVAGVPNYWGGYHAGEGGPATAAYLWGPGRIEVAPDGTLYIGEAYWISKVDPEGIFSSVVSGGTYSGAIALDPDGSLYYMATAGYSGVPSSVYRYGSGSDLTNLVATLGGNDHGTDLAVDPEGRVYLTTQSARGVLRITDEGTLVKAVGSGAIGSSPDFTPAAAADLNAPSGLAFGPRGDLYLADAGNCRVLRVQQAFGATDLLVSAQGGAEIYVFDETGRHLKTVQALTGATLYEFAYDADGLLVEVTDGDGNVTIVERDGVGNPVAIVAPFGQRTELGLDLNGWLASVTNPAGEAARFSYLDSGLLEAYTNPRGYSYLFGYDELGRFTSDEDPLGGVWALARTGLNPDGFGYEVTHTSPLGRATTYRVETLPDGGQRFVNTFPDGTSAVNETNLQGKRTATLPDGTTVVVAQGPDPRFGMQAPISNSMTLSTLGGIVNSLEFDRIVDQADPADLFSIQTLTYRVTANGDAFADTYDGPTNTHTYRSPGGRQTLEQIDDFGRVLQTQTSGLFDRVYDYDAQGHLIDTTQGTGLEARTINFGYDADGYLESISAPLGHTVEFAYDGAGRPNRQTLPDGRQILYEYDANGNLASITPPGQPAHVFRYTVVGLTEAYTAPLVGTENSTISYTYDLDRQPTSITYPDSQQLVFDYDTSGRLHTLTVPEGVTTYTYDTDTGAVAAIAAPGGVTLQYPQPGTLPTQTTWTGEISGTVEFAHGKDFLVTEIKVNGSDPIVYQRDTDRLLTRAGALTLSRDPENGLLTGTTLGSVTTSYAYNGFGEVTRHTTSYGSTEIYRAEFTYDKAGQITRKVETVDGASADTYEYGYDVTGRLVSVVKNDSVISTFGYDDNGNRTHLGGTEVAHFDAQDRLLDHNGVKYRHNANGQREEATADGQVTRYRYDLLGNLRQVTSAAVTQIEYVIDGWNRRVGMKIDGVPVRGFLYQDLLNPVAELDGSNNVVSRFVYASRDNVPDYFVTGGVTYRVIADQLGSPRLVVDVATGSIAQEMSYDAWGRVLLDTNPGFQPFGFAGGLYDPDTGLTRFGARDYDPETGTWTAKDPLLFSGGQINLYTYAKNDPVNMYDATGTGIISFCFRAWRRMTGVKDIIDKVNKTKDVAKKIKDLLSDEDAVKKGNYICENLPPTPLTSYYNKMCKGLLEDGVKNVNKWNNVWDKRRSLIDRESGIRRTGPNTYSW